jgi:hypothetical protein
MAKPTDDRGVPCGIANLTAKQIGWRALGLPSVTKDPIVKQEQSKTIGKETAVAMVGGVVGWVVWSNLVSQFVNKYIGSLLDLIAQMTFAVVVAMIFWYFLLNWIRRDRFDRIAEIYLTAGRCASCGYMLNGLAPDPDDCTVCPECNAAWNQTRIGTPAES